MNRDGQLAKLPEDNLGHVANIEGGGVTDGAAGIHVRGLVCALELVLDEEVNITCRAEILPRN
jgi:hypothetical protein